MQRNLSRFNNELDENLEKFATNFFFSIGTVSAVLSIPTFYLLARNSAFLSSEIRILLLILQVSAFLNNFHFCILFIPFIYPFLGGGFCTGVLCMLGVRFHYGMCFWLFTVIILCASFIVLLFARLQTILHPSSRLKLEFSKRIAFYVYTFSSMLIIPILFIFTDTPIEVQEWIIEVNGLDWIADKKIYSVINGYARRVQMDILIYSILGSIIVFGSITAILFALTLYFILTSNVNRRSSHADIAHRAKIKNSIIFLSQMIVSFCLAVVPFCIMVASFGAGVTAEIEKMVIICESCMTFLSPLNSIIFMLGNRQYVKMMSGMLRRSSTVGRLHSISL